MKINLREEEIRNYRDFFEKFLEEIQNLNDSAMETFNEVMRDSRYDKLQKLISDMIDAYAEMMAAATQSAVFSAWEESEASLHACLRRYRAGDEAVAACAQIESQMLDSLVSILKIEKGEMVITDQPEVNSEGMDRLEEVCRTAQARCEEIWTEYSAEIDAREEDNNIYGTLKPLTAGIAQRLDTFFAASLKEFQKLHQFVEEVAEGMKQLDEERSGAGASADVVSSAAGADADVISSGVGADADVVSSVAGAGADAVSFAEGAAAESVSSGDESVGKTAVDGGDVEGNTESVGGEKSTRKKNGINDEIAKRLKEFADKMLTPSNWGSLDVFRGLTDFLREKIDDIYLKSDNSLNYGLIAELASIYHKFYQECGSFLRDEYLSMMNSDERYAMIKLRYFDSILNGELKGFFENKGEEVWSFISHAHHTYYIFYTAADMLKNVALACISGEAGNNQLCLGASIVFKPILEGVIDKEGMKEYAAFSRWAGKEIYRILGLEVSDLFGVYNDTAGGEASEEKAEPDGKEWAAYHADNAKTGVEKKAERTDSSNLVKTPDRNLKRSVDGKSAKGIDRKPDNGSLAGSEKGLINGEVVKELKKYALDLWDPSHQKDLNVLKGLTDYLYRKVGSERTHIQKTLSYDLIAKLARIYSNFYKDCGELLADGREAAGRNQYIESRYFSLVGEGGISTIFWRQRPGRGIFFYIICP